MQSVASSVSGPSVTFGAGCIRGLPALLSERQFRRVFVVASQRAYADVAELIVGDTRLFNAFTPNPRFEEAHRAAATQIEFAPDVVIGVGGGSALDTAKLARCLPGSPETARSWLTTGPPSDLPTLTVPLVLVPTTAGSGAEMTRFATVYSGDRKYSLDHPAVAADLTLVDPDLACNCPAAVTTACALDAFCHAVESAWSKRADQISRVYSAQALRQLMPLLADGVTAPDAQMRQRLAFASIFAGRAIDITRTTAAHAFAYPLTIFHGIPHGVACAINLQWVADYNAQAGATREGAPRHDVEGSFADGIREFTKRALRRNGWAPRLREYGIDRRSLDRIAQAGLSAASRTQNNPAPISFGVARNGLDSVY